MKFLGIVVLAKSMEAAPLIGTPVFFSGCLRITEAKVYTVVTVKACIGESFLFEVERITDVRSAMPCVRRGQTDVAGDV